MAIRSFLYSSPRTGWFFDKITFGEVNLCIGISGSGKTKLLNLLFNAAITALGNATIIPIPGATIIPATIPATWNMVIEKDDSLYDWTFSSEVDDNGAILITEEKLTETKKETSNHNEKSIIFSRNKDKISLIDLKSNTLNTSPNYFQQISMFSIFPVHPKIEAASTCLKQIIRRQFHGGELERASAYGGIIELRNTTGQTNTISVQQILGIPSLNIKLYLLHRDHREIFDRIVDYFKSAFPLVEDVSISRLDKIDASLIDEPIIIDAASPVVLVKEAGVNKAYPLKHLSSGMLKILIILSDVLSVADDSVYLIDEYENSLGLNAIDILPDLITETRSKIQYIITSHHPYIINNLDIADWIVLKRKGESVNTTSGTELAKRYSRSKQERFIQLINELKVDL